MTHSTIITLIVLSAIATLTPAIETQCHIDCQQPPTLRLLGPTRPSSKVDPIGNDLDISRSHPYSTSEKESSVLIFNVSVRIWMPEYDEAFHVYVASERSDEKRGAKR